MLLKAGGHYNTMRPKGLNNLDTPIHTAVELANMEAIRELLDAGAGVTGLNRAGHTPLHVCVRKELEEELQVVILTSSSSAGRPPLLDETYLIE